jgi:hypothetical protein
MKVLELRGRTFCLLIDAAGDKHRKGTFHRIGRVEIISNKPTIRITPLLFVPEESTLAWIPNTAELYLEENKLVSAGTACD